MRASLLLALALGPVAAAQDAADRTREKDLAAFQGDWRVEWVERDGERTELGDDSVYTIKGNKWLKGGREISAIAIDPGFTPKLLDLTRLVADGKKGLRMEGIYKLDGDTMEWCCHTGEGARSRPTEFKAPKGWDGTLYHMTRVRPDKK